MARVVMQAVVSVDGYIAYPDDTVGPLFDWYGNGDTEVSARVSGWTFHVSQASADYVQPGHIPVPPIEASSIRCARRCPWPPSSRSHCPARGCRL